MQNNQFWFNNKNRELTPSVIGVVAQNNFNSSDWTQEGSLTTWVFNPTDITVVGTAGAFTPLIRYNKWFSQSENFTFTARYSVDLDNTAFLGVGIRFKFEYSSAVNWYAYMSTATVSKGAIYIYRNSTVIVQDLVNVVSYSIGDIIEVSFTVDGSNFTATFQNITLDGPIRTININYPNPYQWPFVNFETPAMFQPAFQCGRGEYTITEWSYRLNNYKNIDLLIIGDSKSEGYYATTSANRYAGLWQSNNTTKKVQVSSSSGAVTQDILNNMPEILLQNPKKVILFIGRNDISNAVPTITWQANYASIVSQLEAIGCDVWHQLPTPDVVVQTALTNYINSTYVNIIDVPPTFVQATDTVDNVHPNVSGSLKIYNEQSATFTI